MRCESLADVIEACRFCFMCRHLATVANVSFREADTPRGVALVLDRVRRDPTRLGRPDFVECLYRNALSGACRTHCVSHYDEVGLVLAAREDVVAAGVVPAAVRALAATLERTGNPFGAVAAGPEAPSGMAPDEVLYILDPYTQYRQPEIATAFLAVLGRLGIPARTLAGVDSGKALRVLGYREQAAAAARRLRQIVAESGSRTVVVSCPALFNAFTSDYPRLGAAFPPDVRVEHTATFLLRALGTGKAGAAQCGTAAFLLDSDFLRHYHGLTEEPRALLRAVGVEPLSFGTNIEESYACGEGAVVYDQLYPEIAASLRARVEALCGDPTHNRLVVASPYTKHILVSGGRRLNVRTLEEVVAEGVDAENCRCRWQP